jgi:lipoteichoic acid synthase
MNGPVGDPLGITRISLRVGPLPVCLCAALCRAVWLSVQLSGFTVSEVGYLLLADVPVIGMLAILAWLEANLGRPWKLVPLLLTIVLVIVYFVDLMAVVGLNARLQLGDLSRFAIEWWLLPGILSLQVAAAAIAVIGSVFVRLRVPRRHALAIPVSGLSLLILPLAANQRVIPSHVQKYTASVLVLGNEFWASRRPPTSRYNAGDFTAYRREYEALFDAPIARSGKDIILVIVESLSASDSFRTAGFRDRLPRFDELGREGMMFRNFLANFEASEGGIVALLSGVPPLHFPTASTDTFKEYSLLPSITSAFKREGYRCEFLTTVPLQFISMHRYATSPLVAFDSAGGQREIPRFQSAPKYSFESPADHVLYEELLSRLPPRSGEKRPPVFLAVVTASSHAPYVDPLGRRNTAENAWSYVQDELWWLHDELKKRQFFENGLLIITGDHRKMYPVQEAERQRFGESAKARIPLAIIGAGVPRDVVDNRLFQQADLLRMLDRVAQLDAELSPFAVWVERYVYVLGVASNATNLEVFTADNDARQALKLNVRGTEIEWVTRPPNALAIERRLHLQRASQQAERAARTPLDVLSFGRDLKPSGSSRGVLVGFSSDVNLKRDPDDPAGSLRMFTTDSFGLDHVRSLVGTWDAPFTITARGFLQVPQDGPYWFSAFLDDEGCLAIDKQIVLGCERGLNEGLALLTAGVHRFDLRFVHRGGKEALRLNWLPPGAKEFVDFPQETLLLPEIPPHDASR